MIKKDKSTVPCIYVISDPIGEEIAGTFYKKKLQKEQIKKSLDIKKVIERTGDKLYVKWKDHDSSFNSWIDKKYIV